MPTSLPFPFTPGTTIDPTTEAAVVQNGGGVVSNGTATVNSVVNAHDATIKAAFVGTTTLDTVGITLGADEGAVSYVTQGSDDNTGTNLDQLGGITLASTGKYSTTFSSTNPILVGASGGAAHNGTLDLTGDSYIIGVTGNEVLLETVITLPNNLDGTIGNRPLVVDSVISDAAFTTTTTSFGTSFAATGAIPCFAAGTRIRTVRGEVSVEALAEGDAVVLHDGATAPITWIGHRAVDLTAHARPHLVRPIVVRAGALADAVPSRDLTVSPDHALLVDGRLVPAKLLVNGASIVQDDTATRVTYYHVELDRHAVLLAENMPAESFLNGGNKSVFEGGVVALHPDFDNAGIEGCAPRATAIDPALWRRYAKRAAARVPAEAPVSAVRLTADGAELRPLLRDGDRLVFAVPPAATSVALVSATHIPAETRPWEGDCRVLGASVERIVLRRNGHVLEVPLDAPGLGAGWHAVERSARRTWRWTDGNAILPARGGDVVEITVTGLAAANRLALAA